LFFFFQDVPDSFFFSKETRRYVSPFSPSFLGRTMPNPFGWRGAPRHTLFSLHLKADPLFFSSRFRLWSLFSFSPLAIEMALRFLFFKRKASASLLKACRFSPQTWPAASLPECCPPPDPPSHLYNSGSFPGPQCWLFFFSMLRISFLFSIILSPFLVGADMIGDAQLRYEMVPLGRLWQPFLFLAI